MAVKLIIGRAGSGKTRYCARGITDVLAAQPLGPRIYWLLPKQATFIAERELACGSGLPGFCRARVLSFDQFADDVLNDCGGSSIPQITSLGRQMALGHLLRKHERELRFFQSVARQPGLAAELDATLAELERCGQDPADIRKTLEPSPGQSASDPETIALIDKLADLDFLSRKYGEFLGQERLDQHKRLERVLDGIARCSFISTATFYVDGFTEFTEPERKMLVAIGQSAQSLALTLTIDPQSSTIKNPAILPAEMSLFHRTEMTLQRLRSSLQKGGVPIEILPLDNRAREVAPAIKTIESQAFAAASAPVSAGGGNSSLQLTEAPSRQAEVNAAAREIVRLVAEENLRYRDVAVMVRSLEPYLGLIDAAFAEHRIPWFADRRRSAAHHPLVQLLRALFQIVRFEWPHDAVMVMLKGGLVGGSMDSTDAIENYVLRHGLVGRAWTAFEPWNYRSHFVAAEDTEQVLADESTTAIDAERRRLLTAITPFAASLSKPGVTISQIASETFACLERLGARQELQRWMETATAAGQFEQAQEHEQVWEKLVDLFEQMVDLLGAETVTLDDFVVVFDSGLEQFDLALAPATVDQVLIGQVDRTHTPAIKACLVLGLSKGDFPAVARDRTVLSERERRSLARKQVELSPGIRRQQLDEQFLGYTALTRASDFLWVSRPMATQGHESAPSEFWIRLRQLFPQLLPNQAPEPGRVDAEAIATPRQLIAGVMRWARQSAAETSVPAEEIWQALYTLLGDHPPGDDAVDLMRFRAWKALAYDNSARLSAAGADRLFRRPLQASVTQLESFAACPYQHFARFGLGLQPRSDRKVGARDLSNVYHDLLHKLMRSAIARAGGDGMQPITPQAVHIEADRATRLLANELFAGNGRNRYLLRTIERSMLRIVAAQQATLARGNFSPAQAGMNFGLGGDLGALRIQTPGGAQTLLHGRIDRVDRANGSAAVIDYRLTPVGLSLEQAYHGLSLRLLAHLLAMEVLFPLDAGSTRGAVAALELPLLRKLKREDDPDSAPGPADEQFHLAQPPVGVVSRSSAREFDVAWTSGKSLLLGANIKKDGSPGLAGILLDDDRLTDLLRFAWIKIGELADAVLAGTIGVQPYRLRDRSPCVHCDFRAVCRFESEVNHYRTLPPIETNQLWAKIEAKAAEDV